MKAGEIGIQKKRNKTVVCVLKVRIPHVENLANEAEST